MKADIELDFEMLEKEVMSRNQKVFQDVQEAIQTAKNSVNTLNAKGWSGEAQVAFAGKFEAYESEAAVLCGHMIQLTQALNTIGQDGTYMVREKSEEVEKTL